MTSKLKRGPFSKAEIFYIEGNRDSVPVENIAEDLTRSKTSIENYLKKHPKQGLTVGDQFARQSGATIMTENASMMADQTKKQGTRTRPNCVTKIK